MTEEQIEQLAEIRMDALDRAYLGSGMTHDEYQSGVDAVDREYRRAISRLISQNGETP
jgi:hypothetical protein